MVLNNGSVDPYSPAYKYYECGACGYRETTDGHRAECPDCGSTVSNLAVPRE
jgi:rubrerythrin